MKIDIQPTVRDERVSLFQKLRLARATRRRGAEITVELSARDVAALAKIGRNTWTLWSGGEMAGLAGEIERAQPNKDGGAKAMLSRAIEGDDDLAAIERRARIFQDLVRFSVSELALKDASRGRVLTLSEAEEPAPAKRS